MLNSILVFTFIILALSPLGLAQTQQGVKLTIYDKDLDRSVPVGGHKCQSLFLPTVYSSQVRELKTDGVYNRSFKYLDSQSRDPETLRAVKRILANWFKSGHYNQDNIAELFNADKSLPVTRTRYIEFENEGITSGIRILDGSTNLSSYGIEWIQAEPSGDKKLLMERRDPDLLLAERSIENTTGKPAYLWELGLLDVSGHYLDAVKEMYGAVAQLLDQHYNDMNMEFMGSTEVIKAKNFKLYGVARPKLVEVHQKSGWQVVIKTLSDGTIQPKTTYQGLVLLKMDGEDFLKKHLPSAKFPSTKLFKPNEADDFNDLIARLQARNREVDATKASGIKDENSFNQFYLQMILPVQRQAQAAAKNSPEQILLTRLLLERYYIAVNSMLSGDPQNSAWKSTLMFLKDISTLYAAPATALEILAHSDHLRDQFISKEPGFKQNTRFSTKTN